MVLQVFEKKEELYMEMGKINILQSHIYVKENKVLSFCPVFAKLLFFCYLFIILFCKGNFTAVLYTVFNYIFIYGFGAFNKKVLNFSVFLVFNLILPYFPTIVIMSGIIHLYMD